MAFSYKTYSETKDYMKKYVNAAEASVVYSLGKTRIMTLAAEAGAIYKVGNSALVNTEVFEKYLEKFHENPVPLPKHVFKNPEKYKNDQNLVE